MSFRSLSNAICSYKGQSLFDDVLQPWVASNTREVEWLQLLAALDAGDVPSASKEDLWGLYAASRVNEHLLMTFQPARGFEDDWPGHQLSTEQYLAFMRALSFTAVEEATYSPFYHEVVTVSQSTEIDDPTKIVRNLWPCLMLGNMMFSRAGVEVSAGTRVLDKEIAETSTLYWSYRRKYRPVSDLSHGWGGNSQWRTDFRRDFRTHSYYIYNADGKHDALGQPARGDTLATHERIEILQNRCFTTSSTDHRDLFPFHYRLAVAVDARRL